MPMQPWVKVSLIGGAAAAGVVGGGYLWWRVSPTTFPFPSLFPASVPAGAPQVVDASATYVDTATGGSPATSVAVNVGDVVDGTVQIKTGAGSGTITLGVRAWTLDIGSTIAPALDVGGGISGTVEGHLFKPGTTSLVQQITAAANDTVTVTMQSGAVNLPGIAFVGPPQIAIVWAIGPVQSVLKLPKSAGSLPSGGPVYLLINEAAIVPAGG